MVIDEGAFIPTEIYNILYPCCDANNAPILVISTPLFMEGEFYNLYISNSDLVKTYDWSKYDTSKYLSTEKLEYYRQTIAPLKFRSEYLGEFITEGSYIFGDFIKCIKQPKNAPYYGGIDWGSGNGGDYTVLTLMDREANVTHIYSWKNLDSVLQIEEIAKVLEDFHIQVVEVEMNSIGRIYYDQLKRKYYKVYHHQ